ncbi:MULTISPECIES: hypothetical protein [unclassified Crossiella]|uniref:hypothetical protein n=1 Tax=unclassified Crossiella TaxID=2620835 RepID=UPI0020000804|nr:MULTISPECIES: hypothetical protein [unclassified Crossiella]MCK2237417.1 hypothetical protein [Crossiella sp. S99.2]MCK2251072.1 hypothetical protein [Crossiella sp. S99.1]
MTMVAATPAAAGEPVCQRRVRISREAAAAGSAAVLMSAETAVESGNSRAGGMSAHTPGLIEDTHFVWWKSTLDGEYHALWSKEIAAPLQDSLSAMCQLTAGLDDWPDRTGFLLLPACDPCLRLASKVPWPQQGIEVTR